MPRQLPFALMLLASLAASACSRESGGAASAARPRADQLVETTAVATTNVVYEAVRTGTLTARREVRIFNQEEGRVIAVPYYQGDRVAKGEMLVRLDDALLRAELEKAVANRKQAEVNAKRLRELVRNRLVSDDELTRANTALDVARAEEQLLSTRLGYSEIRAPFDGVVTARLAEPGDVAARYTHLLTLTDPRALYTEVTVSELLLPHVQVGDAVELRIDALGEQRFAGRIQRIHPKVDPNTRLGTLEIALTPVPEQARAGQLARVILRLAPTARRVVPYDALRRDSAGEFVFTIDAEGRAHRTMVRTGLALAENIEILEGLNDGEHVITRGFLGLTDGTKVKVVAPRAE